jgi:predicted DNA-binding transcriptional regulator AlpA
VGKVSTALIRAAFVATVLMAVVAAPFVSTRAAEPSSPAPLNLFLGTVPAFRRRLFRPGAAAEFLNMSRSTLWREIKAGRIAPPIALTNRIRVFTEEYLNQLIEQRAKRREAQP